MYYTITYNKKVYLYKKVVELIVIYIYNFIKIEMSIIDLLKSEY